jgi:hypothetical protein
MVLDLGWEGKEGERDSDGPADPESPADNTRAAAGVPLERGR